MRPVACACMMAGVVMAFGGHSPSAACRSDGKDKGPGVKQTSPDKVATEVVYKAAVVNTAFEGKVTKISISEDFYQIKRMLEQDEKIKKAVAKLVKESKDPLDEAEATADLLVAIWFEWRIPSPDAVAPPKNLLAVVDRLEDFTRVRFKSEPGKADVFINGIIRGRTPYHVFLNRKGTFELKMTLDGYESWERKGFVPTGRGDAFEEKLKKSAP